MTSQPSHSPMQVSDQEAKLLLRLRSLSEGTVSAIIENGSIDRIEIQQPLPTKKRIIDALSDSSFQDIEIKQRHGKIVRMMQKMIEKL